MWKIKQKKLLDNSLNCEEHQKALAAVFSSLPWGDTVYSTHSKFSECSKHIMKSQLSQKHSRFVGDSGSTRLVKLMEVADGSLFPKSEEETVRLSGLELVGAGHQPTLKKRLEGQNFYPALSPAVCKWLLPQDQMVKETVQAGEKGGRTKALHWHIWAASGLISLDAHQGQGKEGMESTLHPNMYMVLLPVPFGSLFPYFWCLTILLQCIQALVKEPNIMLWINSIPLPKVFLI